MGKYVAPSPVARTLADTLIDAENEHFLDCPNADLAIRGAALLLDLILCSLGSSGIHHFCNTLLSSHSVFLGNLDEPFSSALPLMTNYFSWILRTIGLYLYLIWTIPRFGATPAKLILGLRVIDESSGVRLTYGQVFSREIVGKLLGSLLLVSLVVPVLREDRRGFHDLLSGSVVKKVHG